MASRFICLALTAMLISPISAEVTVSVTLTGPLEELLPVLQQLQKMGLGLGPEAPDDGTMTVRLHSITSREGEEVVDAQPLPSLALTEPSTQPESVDPGANVLVTVKVIDSDGVVDTVVAAPSGSTHLAFDLYDNGTKGDETAGDGTWSYSLPVPASAGGGLYTMNFKAFDRMGDQIFLDGGERPLTAEATFEIMPEPDSP